MRLRATLIQPVWIRCKTQRQDKQNPILPTNLLSSLNWPDLYFLSCAGSCRFGHAAADQFELLLKGEGNMDTVKDAVEGRLIGVVTETWPYLANVPEVVSTRVPNSKTLESVCYAAAAAGAAAAAAAAAHAPTEPLCAGCAVPRLNKKSSLVVKSAVSRICRFGEEHEEQLKKLIKMQDEGSKLAEKKLEQDKLRQACIAAESKEEGRDEVLDAVGNVCP